ncbi:hypothetical protein IAT38_005133 [Cryptococcus sp. DSM 104549]
MNPSQFNGKLHRASEPSSGVLLLEVDRPPVNAYNTALWQELHVIVDKISDCPDVRAVVLSSSNEKTFTAGLDLKQPSSVHVDDAYDPARKAMKTRDHLREFQAAITSLEKCRVPIIVTLFGPSVGLAIDIASACDIRVCTSTTQFGIFEVTVGLAADIGTLQRFPKIVGNGSKARELALTGRMFGAAEALEIGFVSKVVEGGRQQAIDAAVDIAKVIATKSPIAVIGTKHMLNYSRDHTVDEGLEYHAAWNMAMLQTSDMPRAMKAQLKKEIPSFPSWGAGKATPAKL